MPNIWCIVCQVLNDYDVGNGTRTKYYYTSIIELPSKEFIKDYSDELGNITMDGLHELTYDAWDGVGGVMEDVVTVCSARLERRVNLKQQFLDELPEDPWE